jgi:hypothetical protein
MIMGIEFIKMVEVLLQQVIEVVDTEDLQEPQSAVTLVEVRTGTDIFTT